MIGGSSASYLARTPCVPLFGTQFNGDGNRRAFRPGEGGDHFHCTVEPSPGHIRCRDVSEKVGYGMVVDGIAKSQALKFAFRGLRNFSGPKIPKFRA